ncbi:MAG: phage tail protein [Acidobacteriota bacterium]
MSVLKEEKRPGTPLFLFECRCSPTQVFYWSSHVVTVDGISYEARVLDHSSIEYRMVTGDESAFAPRISVRLANADQALSGLISEQQWKGSELTIRFVVYNLEQNTQCCDPVVMLRGSVNAPDEVDYKSIRLSVVNRLGSHRSHLPSTRIQKRCVWLFPRNQAERIEATQSGGGARYSPFYGCGYSSGVAGGVGNDSDDGPFTICNYTKSDCVERGMYDSDAGQQPTRRFAGFQFIPATRLVRAYGERNSSLSAPMITDAVGAELIPLAYGTVWTDGIVTIAQSDGNLHRMEVALCSGPIAGVIKVVVEGVEIPVGVAEHDMTATGWYNVVSHGNRSGEFNLDFRDEVDTPMGDPNGGTAILSVIVPSAIVGKGPSVSVQVLVQGLIVPTYDINGQYTGDSYSSNPAWMLLDVMRRSGYREEELELSSFAVAASRCSEVIVSVDSNGNEISAPRSECNVLLRSKRSVSEIMRGIQIGSEISLRCNQSGKFEAFVECALSAQHPELPPGSTAVVPLNGGWPAYEFGDGSDGSFGILLTQRGEPTLRLFSRSHAETANRVTVEFIDPINDYILDSYSLVDLDDVVRIGQEVSARIAAVGISGQAQASRICRKVLAKNLEGNIYAEFETSIKAISIRPSDIITINVPSSGLARRMFRVLSVAPGFNGERVRISAQVHKDEWYAEVAGDPYNLGSGCNSALGGDARPLLGDALDDGGEPVYSVTEEYAEASDGSQLVRLRIGFTVPHGGSGSLKMRPLVSLIPQVMPSGGTLAGPQNLYYAVAEIDGSARESQVSSTIHAFIPSADTNVSVQLSGIRMSPNGIAINVYRGQDPWRLRRIASEVSADDIFTDTGLPLLPVGPPDPNFAKARFEWRSEYLPPLPVSFADMTGVTVSGTTLVPNVLKNKVLRVVSGAGATQERVIVDNTESEVLIAQSWNTVPDTSSSVCVVEAGWNLGGESNTSPVFFEVPNQSSSTIHIRGYGLNGAGSQSRKELGAIVRHVIGGAFGPDQDADVPAVPTFGLSATDRGFVEIGGIGFSHQTNISTISSGTAQIHYLDELNLVPTSWLAEGISSTSSNILTSTAVSISPGTLLRLGPELMRAVSSTLDSFECELERGVYGTTAVAHEANSEIYQLERKVSTIPIPRQFFGSAGSGDFSYAVPLANSRVLAADLLFTNSRGNSEAGQINFCSLADGGLRVLSGGQISIQVGGYLGIQSPAAPPIVVEEGHAIRDIFAVVKEPPVGAPIVMVLRRNSDVLCHLTIAEGDTISNIVPGEGVEALLSMQQVSLDIVSVGQGGSTLPGRDLTVTIRL